MGYQPYKDWNIETFKLVLLDQVSVLDTNESEKEMIRVLIKMAMKDTMWNPKLDFDGCTAVQDTTHPDVACFLHDWLFKARYFKLANFLFGYIMAMQPMSKCKRRRRLIAVKIATVYFKLINKKVSNYSLEDIQKIINLK